MPKMGSSNMEQHFSNRDISSLIEDGIEEYKSRFVLAKDYSEMDGMHYRNGVLYLLIYLTGGGMIYYMSEYEDKIKKIKQIEQDTLSELARIRIERDKIVSNYITSLKEKKIEDLKKDIQSL